MGGNCSAAFAAIATAADWPSVWAEIKQHKVLAYESLNHTKESRDFDVEAIVNYLEFDGKEYACGSILDISERKRQGHALQQAEEKYREIFDNAVVGIFQTTPEGRYLRVNHELARMAGYDSPEELMAAITDLSAQAYVNPDRRDEFRQQLHEHEVVRNFECEVYRKDI